MNEIICVRINNIIVHLVVHGKMKHDPDEVVRSEWVGGYFYI
jgi:hypothetical protein